MGARASRRTVADVIMVVVAGAESAALLAYAAGTGILAATQGLEGPADVSSPTGVVLEVALFALFGIGMAFVAVGRRRRSHESTVPFVVAQLLALTVGVPLATGAAESRWAGLCISVTAAAGLAAMLVGSLTRPNPRLPIELTLGEAARADESVTNTTLRGREHVGE